MGFVLIRATTISHVHIYFLLVLVSALIIFRVPEDLLWLLWPVEVEGRNALARARALAPEASLLIIRLHLLHLF